MSELQHPDSRTFELVADLYERVRPSYPEEAVDWLARQLEIEATSTVLDLGAGTGKLTRALVPRARRVIAVEPGPEMLNQLRQAVPGAEALLGAAEAIPLADNSVDAVVCGQSFHWFRTEEAVTEIGRVLRPGGGLGLIWNMRDSSDPLQREISSLIEPFVPPGRPPIRALVADFVERTFGEVAKRTFPFPQELAADEVIDRIFSISFVAAASDASRRELERSLREVVGERGEPVSFPYLTDVFAIFNVA